MTTSKAVIYIGPTVPKLGLTHNRLFKGGIPLMFAGYAGLFEKYKLLSYLFVLPSDYPAAKKKLAAKGSLEAQAVLELKEGENADGNV